MRRGIGQLKNVTLSPKRREGEYEGQKILPT